MPTGTLAFYMSMFNIWLELYAQNSVSARRIFALYAQKLYFNCLYILAVKKRFSTHNNVQPPPIGQAALRVGFQEFT